MGEERVLWDFPSSPILFYGLAQAPENSVFSDMSVGVLSWTRWRGMGIGHCLEKEHSKAEFTVLKLTISSRCVILKEMPLIGVAAWWMSICSRRVLRDRSDPHAIKDNYPYSFNISSM
jgi:hypothetical protein